MKGKVYFIGAGPGDRELITVRGARILKKVPLIIYAGSLVPCELVQTYASEDARIIDSAPLTLENTHALIKEAVFQGKDVARVHTGEPSLYGAIHEQIFLLEEDGIEYEVIPGITAAFATACRMGISFTVPEKVQSLIITRSAGRTPMPEKEELKGFASHHSAMAIYLSASNVKKMQQDLLEGGYSPDTMVVIGYRVGWEDEKIVCCSLNDVEGCVLREGITRQAVFLILPAQRERTFSRLYDPHFSHGFRRGDG